MMVRTKQRGGVYLLVLVSAGISMSIGVLAVTTAAAEREIQELTIERDRAVMRAESGIHLALDAIDSDAAWRTLPSGRVVSTLTMERGELWVDATDSDGSLTDDDADPFTLTSTATYGSGKQSVAVDVEYEIKPIEAAWYPVAIAGGAGGSGELCAYTYRSFIPACAGGGGLQLDLDVLYRAENMNWIDQPSSSIVQDYAAIGTLIPASVSHRGRGELYRDLDITTTSLSAGITRDPRHIYVIDGAGGDVQLQDSALVGTLVIVNARSFALREPTVARVGPEGLPLILADCDVNIIGATPRSIDETWPDTDDLSEGPDFDEATFDGVQGIIYVDGDIILDGEMEMRGSLVVTGSAVLYDKVTIRHVDAYVESPPPGFQVADAPKIVSGTWRAVVD